MNIRNKNQSRGGGRSLVSYTFGNTEAGLPPGRDTPDKFSFS
jgi:hypothetical protein